MNDQSKMKKINCFDCVYFKITYSTLHPRACLQWGFKGMQMPSIAYFQSVGKNCEQFVKKENNR